MSLKTLKTRTLTNTHQQQPTSLPPPNPNPFNTSPPMSTPNPHPTILLLYGNGGGGHKATAAAMNTALTTCTHYQNLDVRVVDAAALSGAAAGDGLYNLLLSYNAVSAIELMHSAIQLFWPIAKPSLLTTFRAYWAKHPNLAVVVSFIPMLNAIFADTLPPHIPLLTVLTDFSHTDSHPWIQHPRQHLVLGTDVAEAQARAHGHLPLSLPSPSHVCTRTSGMVVHPKFYNRVDYRTRAETNERFGLHPKLPTVLVLYGGSPPTDRVTHIVDAFLARPAENAVNIIAVCARNQHLLNRLQRRKSRFPDRYMFLTGYSDDVPMLMQISDVLVGKPGPGAVSEAYVSGLPCVLITGADDCHVMKQERVVLDWVRSAGIGLVAKTCAEAANISMEHMRKMRNRIQALPKNNAVFEVRRLILGAVGLEEVDEQLPNSKLAMESEHLDDVSSSEDGQDLPELDLGDFATPTKAAAECSSSITDSETSREASPCQRILQPMELNSTANEHVQADSGPPNQQVTKRIAHFLR